jgi:hypothetical protein
MWIPRLIKRLDETLHAEARAIQQVLKDQTAAIEAASSDSQTRENKERPLRVAAHRIQLHEAKEASRYRKGGHWNQVILNLLTLLAVAGAWVYAAITFCTLKELRNQTVIQRQSAESSQRAWVGLESIPIADAIQANPLLLAGHFTVKNFGVGPAIKVDVFSEPEVWDGKTKIKPGHDYMAAGRSICNIPVAFVTNTVNGRPNAQAPGPMGYILFPGGTHAEQVGGGPWTGDPVPPIAHLWFVGCIAYLDQFNTLHWTRFCVESSYFSKFPLSKDAPLQYCALFNDTDDNKEKD